MLLAQHGKLHGFLYQTFLAFAVGHVAAVVVFDFDECMNFAFTHWFTGVDCVMVVTAGANACLN